MIRQAESYSNDIVHDRAMRRVVDFAVSEQRYLKAEDAADIMRTDAGGDYAYKFVAICMTADRHFERGDQVASKIKNELLKDSVKSKALRLRLEFLNGNNFISPALVAEPPCRRSTSEEYQR